MTNASLNDPLTLINQQVKNREFINLYLSRAESLALVAESEDFLNFTPIVIKNYLSALSNFISNAKHLNENALKALLDENLFG